MFEIIGNLIFLGVSTYLVVLLLKKRQIFPKWYLRVSLLSAAFIGLHLFIVRSIFPDAPMTAQEILEASAPVMYSLIVWSPYLFLAERSKHTFIR